MRFFAGLHHPSDAKHTSEIDAAFISVNTIRDRKSPFKVGDWIMDSGAFTEVVRHGGYRFDEEEYASQIRRWANNGNLLAAVAQDYMCEAFVLAQTGKTVREHQQMTVDRYDALMRCDVGGVYIMPVLQGYDPETYVDHIRDYGSRLSYGMWVGVGSVCKRNATPKKILDVLIAIKTERPDLRLHGFGVKKTSLANGTIRSLLFTADSMAWSFAARYEGRNANDWREAAAFKKAVDVEPKGQRHLIELFVESCVV